MCVCVCVCVLFLICKGVQRVVTKGTKGTKQAIFFFSRLFRPLLKKNKKKFRICFHIFFLLSLFVLNARFINLHTGICDQWKLHGFQKTEKKKRINAEKSENCKILQNEFSFLLLCVFGVCFFLIYKIAQRQ